MRRLLPLALLAAACQQPPEAGGAPDAGDLVRSGDLALVRMVRWPGGGRELTVRLGDDDTDGDAPDLTSAIRLTPDDAAPVVRRVALTPGYTAILVRPGADETARDAQASQLRELVGMRPAAEQIALFRWGGVVEQVVGFTADRARLDRDLVRALALDDEPTAEPISSQLAVAEEVQQVGGIGPRVMRAVVVVGADPSPEARVRTAMPILGISGASARIDRLAAETHYGIAVCAGAEMPGSTLTARGVDGELPIDWPDAWPESLDEPCDAERIGALPQPVPEVVQLTFTDEQREVYDQRVSAVSKAEFALGVVLAPGQPAIAATAHLRGKGTLACERKSYTVTLDGPGRHFFPDTYADEVYLIAMCGDERYIQLHTAYTLMAPLGFFPFRFRYVELLLEDETRGVYLLVEKADDALERGSSRASAVLRRRFDPPQDRMEVEKSDAPQEAIAAWESFLEDLGELADDELEAAARDRMDLDAYLDWLALMTALGNGDYVDEVWVTATDARDDDGGVRPYWDFAGWDCDDLFDACHYAGSYAFVDPNELYYCAEGRIDQILLGDPLLYARAVDHLEGVLERVTPEVMQAALDGTAAGLLPYFERPEICAASHELLEDNPAAIEPEEAQRDIRDSLDQLYQRYAERRALLLERIATYRAAQ